MELIFLGENFEPVSAPIDKYYSFEWTEKYYGSGEFTLHLSPEYLPTVLRAAYIYNNDADEAMLIERVEAHDADSKTLEIGGMSLDGIFKWRVMDSADTYTGRVEDIARQAVQKYAMSGERAFPLLKLGRDTNIPDTISTGSKVGSTLYDWLHDTLKPFEISWRLHYNYEANELLFEVYKGLDRTQDQDANTWAIFSTSFENLTSFTYQRNAIDYRNYAIVTKRDSNAIVAVDKTNGGTRREMYIEVDGNASVDQMRHAGEEALAEYQLVETIDGEIQPGANLVYGRDYSLGDLCNLEGAELGISASARLTQMTTVVENGVIRRIPAFGEQYLSLRQYIARAAGSGGGSVVAAGGGGGSSSGGVNFIPGNGLTYNTATNTLSVDAADDAIKDNTKPITSAAVYNTIGNINALLATI